MANITVNISFQDQLLREIDRAAQGESRSRSELLREAARAYIQRKQRWAGMFRVGQTVARQRGLSPSDVGREISAYRKEKAARR